MRGQLPAKGETCPGAGSPGRSPRKELDIAERTERLAGMIRRQDTERVRGQETRDRAAMTRGPNTISPMTAAPIADSRTAPAAASFASPTRG